MPAGVQKIVFEIDAETAEFQTAVQRAAASLKNLGDVLTREQSKTVAGDKAVEASNQSVSSSYQATARSALAAAVEQVQAVGQVDRANREAAAVAEASAAAQENASRQVVEGYAAEAAAAKASAAAQEAAAVKARAAQALGATPVRPGVPGAPGVAGPGGTTVIETGGNEISGARGTKNPGSITNPVVVAIEAGRYTSMGNLAAAIGEEAASPSASETKAAAAKSVAGAEHNPMLAGILSAEDVQTAAAETQTVLAARQAALLQELIAITAAAGGSGGGGRRVDIYHHASGESGGPPVPGGGGDNGSGIPWSKLLWGGGIGGLAGIGTLGSFAGLGLEHVLTTLIALAGSLASAMAGAGVLAAGAFAQMAVGAGSDALVMSSTIADTKTLYADYTNIAQAVAVYGKNSQQAQQAQRQLNYDMAALGNTAGVKAEAALAKAAQALNTFWDQQTSQARVQAVAVLTQVLQLARTYVPLVAQAAQQNLQIINTDIKPLFTWLQGPDGIGVWNNLENNFQQQLPTAINAFTQAVELVLRSLSIASNYTGGFVSMLDRLFTRLNSMDNFQLNAVIQKLIADFRVWEQFVKYLIVDIFDLFHQDVGTGNAIIQTLTQMLIKLHQWETSVQGMASLTSIFTVHKQEIVALLQVIPLLIKAFAPIYMAVAPALTAAFTAVLKVFLAIINAIESFPGGAWALGLTLIALKLGILIPLLKSAAAAWAGLDAAALAGTKPLSKATVGEVANAVGGTGAGAAGSAGAGGLGAAIAGKLGSLLPAGLAGGISGLMTRLAALGRMLIPGGLVGIGLAALVKALNLVPAPTDKASESVQQMQQQLQQLGTAALNQPGGKAGGPTTIFSWIPGVQSALNALFGTTQRLGQALANTAAGRQVLADWVSQVSKMGNVAHLSTSQIQALAVEGGALAKAFQGTKFESIIQQFLQPLDSELQKLNGTWLTMMNRWYEAAGAGLPKIVDVFQTNWRLIANSVGTNSAHGREMLAQNLTSMVTDITGGMAKGRISVQQGMSVIQSTLARASKAGVNATAGNFASLFSTLATLFAKGKIAPQQYFAYVEMLAKQQTQQTTQSAFSNWSQYMQRLTTLWQKGRIQANTFLGSVKSSFETYTNQTVASTASSYASLFGNLANWYQRNQGQTAVFQSGVTALWKQANAEITSNINQATQQQQQILQQWRTQQLQQDGSNVDERKQTWHQYWAAIHGIDSQAVGTAKSDMTLWALQILTAMNESGKYTTTGVQEIATQLNKLLGSVGATKIPVPSRVADQSPGATAPGSGSRPPTPHATGGMMVGSPTYIVGEEGPAHPEFVIATNPAYRQRNVGLWAEAGQKLGIQGFAQGGVPGSSNSTSASAMARMISEASWITAQHYPYVWGGGHNPSFSGPYDCSGAVSAVLHAGGLLPAPMVAAQFMSYGLPGPGPASIYASSGHVYMSLDGRNFGTSSSNPGGGADWFAPYPGNDDLPGFVVRHPPNVPGGGGFISTPHVSGTGVMTQMVQKGMDKTAAAANAYWTKKTQALVGGGQYGGGNAAPGNIPSGGNEALVQSIVAQLTARHGWPSSMAQDWMYIIGAEDGSYSLTATNPSSGAYGLAQFIQGPSAYYTYGGNPGTYLGQLTAMGNYIQQRYGNPSNAWAFHVAHGWYKRGGILGEAIQRFAQGGKPGLTSGAPGGTLGTPGSSFPGGDNLWDFIHHTSPTFPIKDLGRHWTGWLSKHLDFSLHPTPSDITPTYMNNLFGWVNGIVNTTVPKIQEREQYLNQTWSLKGSPTKKQMDTLVGLDQQAVAWLLWAVHALDVRRGPLEAKIDSLGKAGANGSEVNTYKKLQSTLNQDMQKLTGLSGIGGMLGDAEYSLEQLLGQSRGGGQKAQQLLQLEQQQLLYAAEKLAIARADDKALQQTIRQLAPLVNNGVLPGYAHGGPVMSTGLALVHRDEWISPDPQGPYGSQLAPAAGGSCPPVNVYLVGKQACSLEELIDCRVNYGLEHKATGVVNRRIGRKSRVLANSPGSPPVFVGRRR